MYHITWWMAKFATKKIPCFPSPEPNPLWITTISGVWSRKLGLHTWSNGATHKTLWQSSFNFERILCNSKREKWGALNMNWDPSSQKNMPHFLWSLSHWKNHASFRNGYYSIEPCNALSFILVQYFTATVLGFTCGLVTSTPVTMSYIPPSESSHFINRNHKIKNDFKENFRQNPFKENKMEPKTIEFSISDFHFVCRTDSKTTFRFPMTFQKTSPLAGGRQGRTTLVSPLATKTSNKLLRYLSNSDKVGGWVGWIPRGFNSVGFYWFLQVALEPDSSQLKQPRFKFTSLHFWSNCVTCLISRIKGWFFSLGAKRHEAETFTSMQFWNLISSEEIYHFLVWNVQIYRNEKSVRSCWIFLWRSFGSFSKHDGRGDDLWISP